MSTFTIIPLLLALAWKSTLVLGCGLLGCAIAARRASAAERHLVIAAALLVVLALPAVALLAPTLPLRLPPSVDAAGALPSLAAEGELSAEREPANAAPLAAPTAAAATSAVPAAAAAGVAWAALATALALLARMLHARRRTARWVRSLEPAPPAWQTLIDAVRAELELRRAVGALRDPASRTPWTWGIRDPVIVLPAEFARWSAEERRAAVIHELAHVRRHDQLILTVAGVCVALYWWQPLAWLSLRRLRQEAEQACDDGVLLAGGDDRHYAAQLLELARAIKAGPKERQAAVAMARPSSVALRLRSILNPHLRRTAMNPRLSMLALLAATAVLAAVGPIAFVGAQEPPVSGRLDDPAFQLLAARGPANDVELGTLVATYVANERQALAVQTLVDYLVREDVADCHFCSEVLRPGRPLFASAPVLGTFVAPAWSGLRDALDAAFNEIERRAYDASDGHLLVKLANIYVGTRSFEATGKATWYLLAGLNLDPGAQPDRIKPLAMQVLHTMGRREDAAIIARELHDDPTSRFYQSQDMLRWIAYFEQEGRRLDALSARLRGAPAEGEDYLPIHKPAPRYPQAAATQGLEGHVVVQFTVAANGRPRNLTVVESTDPIFEEASLEAARAFLYMPRYVNGVPVDVPGVRNKITFVLDQG